MVLWIQNENNVDNNTDILEVLLSHVYLKSHALLVKELGGSSAGTGDLN